MKYRRTALLALVITVMAAVAACSSSPAPTEPPSAAEQALSSNAATPPSAPTPAVNPQPTVAGQVGLTATDAAQTAVSPSNASSRQPAAVPSSAPALQAGTRIGSAVPEFTITTTSGARLTKADLQGKPYLLFFFATW
jgi:hypothetical protein